MNRILNNQDFVFITPNYRLLLPLLNQQDSQNLDEDISSVLGFFFLPLFCFPFLKFDREETAMSRKQSQKDSSGFIFDLQSNTVLAQGGTFENMKEKINAVRAIVPNKSNNEIILVLQHFDNCVDKTVQAFMEGSASEVLKEWIVTGKKKEQKEEKQAKACIRSKWQCPRLQ